MVRRPGPNPELPQLHRAVRTVASVFAAGVHLATGVITALILWGLWLLYQLARGLG